MRPSNVVKAYNAKILGHAPLEMRGGAHRSDGHGIVSGTDGCDVRPPLQGLGQKSSSALDGRLPGVENQGLT